MLINHTTTGSSDINKMLIIKYDIHEKLDFLARYNDRASFFSGSDTRTKNKGQVTAQDM